MQGSQSDKRLCARRYALKFEIFSHWLRTNVPQISLLLQEQNTKPVSSERSTCNETTSAAIFSLTQRRFMRQRQNRKFWRFWTDTTASESDASDAFTPRAEP